MITQEFIDSRRKSLQEQQAEAQATFETARQLLQAIHGALQELEVFQAEFAKEDTPDGREEMSEVRADAQRQVPVEVE